MTSDSTSPFYRLPESDMRDICRRHVESLEMWLRRIIEQRLILTYGKDYLFQKGDDGQHFLNNDERRTVTWRLKESADENLKAINATEFSHLKKILGNPEIYLKALKEVFDPFFGDGFEILKFQLSRTHEARTALSHAKPISVRLAEQTICYANDIIQAIKEHYGRIGMASDYNAPTITRLSDSFGNVYEASDIIRNNTGNGIVNRHDEKKSLLRPGDTLAIEAEVDPTFKSDSYTIDWIVPNGTTVHGPRLVLKIEERDVAVSYAIGCTVKSDKAWHRQGALDDLVTIVYKVLPPVE